MANNLKPFVNGISPKEGTPGTKLTIRGDNLGISSEDIRYIFIGKVDVACSVQWHSSKKLNIISPLGQGELKIIVVTKSGGEGTCDVEYFQTISQSVGSQEHVSYWPPNEHKHPVLNSYAKRTQPKHLQSEMIGDIQDTMLGHYIPTNFALSDDELVKYYKGRGSTIVTEVDFNPILWLLKYHFKTNYNDLLQTLENSKTVAANNKMKEPISIVKANLYTIFQCLECLEMLKKKIDDEKSTNREMSGAFAEKNLLLKLETSKNIAHHMYEEVLKHRDYADSVRSALSVMQRFRFLFNLPHSIRENIKKGEYSLVINDYLRARSLFGSSEIRLFQQVYKDVVDVIEKFKEMMLNQLLEMPKKCDEVKITIRLLRQLEIDYDPAWKCLENQEQWILKTIRKLNVNAFSLQTRLDKTLDSSTRIPTVQLIDELNKLLSETFNETWNLVCYYLEEQMTGKYNLNNNDITNRTNAVDTILYNITTAYANKMRDSLFQSNLTSGWLIYCLQHVRTAFESVQMEELPTKSSSVLIGLLEELRKKSVNAVLVHAKQDIVSLTFKETWNSEINDQLGAVTRLPILYRNIMLNSFSEITRIIHTRHKMEGPVFGSPSDQNELSNWILDAMKSFITCIEAILDKINTKSSISMDNSLSDNSPFDSGSEMVLSSLDVPRLLLMANNCHYCITVINLTIVNQIDKLGLPVNKEILNSVQESFRGLNARLVDIYVKLRLDVLIPQVSSGMKGTNYDWKAVPQAKRARGYVHTVLAGLSQAHSELELISPHLSRCCLVRMIVNIVEEINNVVNASNRNEWSRNGHMQLSVDLGLLEILLIALSPEKSTSDILDLSREATSLMNIMRAAYRLVTEEQVIIKNSLDREKISVALLIQGFHSTGI